MKTTPEKEYVKALKTLCNDLKMTIVDFAPLIGSKRRTVSDWFCGRRTPTMETIQSIDDKLQEAYTLASDRVAALETFLDA